MWQRSASNLTEQATLATDQISNDLDRGLYSTLIQADALGHTSDLFWAAASASSQVIPILNKSLLTALLQFAGGRSGSLLNAGTS